MRLLKQLFEKTRTSIAGLALLATLAGCDDSCSDYDLEERSHVHSHAEEYPASTHTYRTHDYMFRNLTRNPTMVHQRVGNLQNDYYQFDSIPGVDIFCLSVIDSSFAQGGVSVPRQPDCYVNRRFLSWSSEVVERVYRYVGAGFHPESSEPILNFTTMSPEMQQKIDDQFDQLYDPLEHLNRLNFGY